MADGGPDITLMLIMVESVFASLLISINSTVAFSGTIPESFLDLIINEVEFSFLSVNSLTDSRLTVSYI